MNLRLPSPSGGTSEFEGGGPIASYLLKGDRDALSDADAHGGERLSAAALLQLQGSRAGDTCAGHAERMAESDGAAIGIDVVCGLIDAQIPKHGDRLAGEGLVQLDDVEVAHFSCRDDRRASVSLALDRSP